MLTLLGLALLGGLLAARGLRESLWGSLVIGFPLAYGLWFVGLNALLYFGWDFATASCAASLPVGLLALIPRCATGEDVVSPAGDGRLAGFAFMLALLVYFVTNSERLNGVDADFWLDFAQQGRLAANDFPPTHPYMPHIALHGHYGRSLFIAGLGWLGQIDAATIQHYAICWAHAWTIPVMVFALDRLGLTSAQTVLATLWLLFAIGCGRWAGLFDASYHHSALAQLGLALMVYCGARLVQVGGLVCALCFVLISLSVGLIFEIYLALALVPFAGLAWRSPHRHGKSLLISLVAASLLSTVQGGVLTDATWGRFTRSTAPVESNQLSNQMQRVQLTFPKSKLGQIYLQPYNHWRISSATRYYPRLYGKPEALQKEYAYVWSAKVLRMHWLPVWLAPLVGLSLCWRPCRGAAFWWVFGAISYAIPALFDFGFVHEQEYFRWEFASAWGFAIALGACLGQGLPVVDRRNWRSSVVVWAVVLGWTAFGCRPGIKMLRHRLVSLDRTQLTTWFAPQVGDGWYSRNTHSLSGLTDGEVQAAHFIADHAAPGDTLFTNLIRDSYRNLFVIDPEAAVVGITGLQCLEHTFPPRAISSALPPSALAGQPRASGLSPARKFSAFCRKIGSSSTARR